MITNLKERTKLDALSYCRLKKMPEIYDGESLWVSAIALVSKSNGQESYVLLRKNEKLGDDVIKDFGSVSSIAVIKEIYPFEFVKKKDLPNFSKKSGKEDRLQYLSYYNNEDYSNLSEEELDNVILGKIVIKKAKEYVF
jgi:hypothetical protein